DGKVTVQEAAEILRLSGKKVRTLIFRKILRPIGSERVLTQGGQARKVLFLSRADVEKYRDEHTVHFGHAQEAGLEEAKRVLREILGDGKPHFADRSAPASGGARGRV